MSDRNTLLDRGPFPERMDVWAEHEHYFHGLHEQLIGVTIETLKQPLREMGYAIGRETSLQLTRRLIPDAYIRNRQNSQGSSQFDYQAVAAALLAEPGIRLENDPDLTAIAIYQREPYQLVTMIEVVSPSNKASDVEGYIKRRDNLLVNQGVNIVEIDITRSYKRLLDHDVTHQFPYHVAIYIPGHGLRVVPMALNEPFKRIALPLAQHALALDLFMVYRNAYEGMGLADLMLTEGFYTLDHLPFASLLTQEERNEALAAVQAWQDAVKQA
jgi:hypothetical protein